jgi:hypothetical protein
MIPIPWSLHPNMNWKHPLIPIANSKPPKQQNSNCKPFPFQLGFRITTPFNSRNQFCASKHSIRTSIYFPLSNIIASHLCSTEVLVSSIWWGYVQDAKPRSSSQSSPNNINHGGHIDAQPVSKQYVMFGLIAFPPLLEYLFLSNFIYLRCCRK